MTTKNKTSKDKCRIKVCKNGPYLVYGKIPLAEQIIHANEQGDSDVWLVGEKYAIQENSILCRCGQSKKRPFCDNTHLKINFNGTETASREPYLHQAEEIDGPTLKLNDAENLCASARFCDRAGTIWNLIPQSDKTEIRKISIEEVSNCPSGRLVVWDKKTDKVIEPNFERSIGLVEDPTVGVSGPIWVRGGIPIESADDTTYEIRNRVTLCRCGKSSNKPFCDSSHYPE
jgi:CDGSH-type Zn-finger protein